MARGVSSGALRTLVFVAVVLFAFWRPLLGGGTLAPDDQVWSSAPFNVEAPASITIEVAEPDSIAVHSMWSRWADDLRDASISQLGDGRTGAPTLADGLPVTHVLYLFAPTWFAPGLVAAAAMLLAMFGMARFVDRRSLSPEAALFGGLVFGLSGLFFVWFGWPHATAFALVPWVFAATHDVAMAPSLRSVGRLAIVSAALLWCGVFAISAYTLLGAVALAAIERRGRAAHLATVAGVMTGGALAAPHLLATSSRWEWADTTAREAVGDTSASLESILTLGLGSWWGNDSIGFPWMASSSFQLSFGFVGLIVLAMVVIGMRDGLQRVVLPASWAVLGIGIAYVGGPFRWLSDLIAGGGAEMTHARVLVVAAAALLAAHGVDRIQHVDLDTASWRPAVSLGSVAVAGLVALVAVYSAVEWIDVARANGAIRASLAQSVPSLLAVAVFALVIAMWLRRAIAAPAVVVSAIALATFELLAVGMAIPTVTDRSERLDATEAHQVLDELVGSDGLVVGDGRTLLPATAARFGPADVRSPRMRSSAELAAIEAVDVDAIRGGATLEQPSFAALDPTDELWARLGVDAFVTAPGQVPPGPVTLPLGDADTRIDPAGLSLSSTVTIEAGVRAVLLDLHAPVGTEVQVDVGGAGRLVFGDAVVVTGSPVVVPVEAESLAAEVAQVTVRVFAEVETATIGVDGAGQPVVGIVGGDPDSEFVVADGLLIAHRPVAAANAENGASIALGPVNDRWLPFVVRSNEPTVVWTDIIDRPGWSVTVDGASSDLVRGVVLGVEVPTGEHEVEFEYRPPGLLGGLLVMIATAVAWLLAASAIGARARDSRH